MTWSHGERLYNLLPAIYRVRDAEQGGPLRALLSIIESELEGLEADIEGLYEDWFVETSAEWVIPYIGDLLGVCGLHTVGSAGIYSLRAYVANTLAYRRRKGTAAVLEQLARDVTGWPARAVEFFQLLNVTQHMNHIQLQSLDTLDLRSRDALERLDGPFEQAAHTIDVRRIASGRGRYNIPNVGLYLWRLQAYPIERSPARLAGAAVDARYTFSPLGCNSPLFNRPQTEDEITQLADEINVPGVLRRYPLTQELEQLRQAIADGTPAEEARRRSLYFGVAPVLRVFTAAGEIPPEEILICNLVNWRRPPADKRYVPSGTTTEVVLPIAVAVDPLLGRLTFPEGVSPADVEVSYAYGFSADIGGGPYDRHASLANPAQAALVIPLAKGTATDTLQKALAQWDAAGRPRCIIQIRDNAVYGGNVDIAMPDEGALTIEAADSFRPSIRLIGLTNLSGPATATLTLSGLLIEGALQIDGDLELSILHCTLMPGRMLNTDCMPAFPDRDSIAAAAPPGAPTVRMMSSISGPIRLPDTAGPLSISDSIINAPVSGGATRPAIAGSDAAAPGPPTTLERVTVLAPVFVRELTLASEVIFAEPVVAERRQVGCVRFSYVPPGSRTPRRFRCQPDLAVAEYAEARDMSVADLASEEQARIAAGMMPLFTSQVFSDPAYAQLSRACPQEIRTGAEDGSEMGAFQLLKQPQREANLRAALAEYLRFGLEAGLIYVT